MKNVFLTGAAGFIGSHLVPVLLDRGCTVTGYDNLSTGLLANMATFIDHPRFRFIVGDLIDSEKLGDTMEGHDLIWHLGANTLIPPGGNNLRIDLHNNTLATVLVLEHMKRLRIKELIFASTAAVYGDEPGAVFDEGFGPLHPISLYGASKLACEGFISAYSHLFGIKASIFRFSNVVGGNMGHGVTYDFIQKLRKTPSELRIWGNGLGHKPYFIVEDCIRGMETCHGIALGDRHLCETFNLGCETITSVDQVGRIVCDEMGLKDVPFVHEGGRHGFPGDVPFVNYEARKANSFGWAVSMTSDDAVRAAAKRLIAGVP